MSSELQAKSVGKRQERRFSILFLACVPVYEARSELWADLVIYARGGVSYVVSGYEATRTRCSTQCNLQLSVHKRSSSLYAFIFFHRLSLLYHFFCQLHSIQMKSSAITALLALSVLSTAVAALNSTTNPAEKGIITNGQGTLVNRFHLRDLR